MPRKTAIEVPFLSRLWEIAPAALKGIGSVESRIEKSLEKYKKSFEDWVMKTVVMGLSIFMSLAFLILGLFFVVIDYGGVPRGVVFIIGGLLGLLVLRLLIPSIK